MGFNRFVRRAPENFLNREQIRDVYAGRRSFLAAALASAAGAVAAQTAPAPAAAGDPAILNLPGHSKSLGQAVAARGYGVPSVWEKNLQRRESPGLTRVPVQASVSFTPLQGCSASSHPAVCTLSGTTRAGGTLTPPSTA
jgi:sulfane dehydrogenase subunit SoxC